MPAGRVKRFCRKYFDLGQGLTLDMGDGRAYNFTMTREQKIRQRAKAKWQEFNRRFFRSRLPMPYFYFSHENSQWIAWHSTRKDGKHSITFVRQNFAMLEKAFAEIIAHEMIHQAQWIAKSARTRNEMHGRFFQYHHIRLFGERYIPHKYFRLVNQ